MAYKLRLDKFDWNDIHADTDEVSGKRVYHTPAGPAPSVTTILGTLPKPALIEWRERVGDEEADRITKEATDIGTLMHDQLEALLLGKEFIPNPDCNPDLYLETATVMANAIKIYGWRHLKSVWAVEIPLHYDDLYAGRTDLVGFYKRHPHIMDYKTSRYVKPEEYLENYRLQIAAYALALQHMFGQRIDHAVNFFAIRPNPEFGIGPKSHNVYMDPPLMREYKLKWIDVLIDFYADDEDKLSRIEPMFELIDDK